jgi:hypothetical protein
MKKPLLYPNPTTGTIHLFRDFPVDRIDRIIALDVLGNEYEVTRLAEGQYSLPQEEGYYHLVIFMDDGKQYIEEVLVLRP